MYDEEVDVPVRKKKNFVELIHEMVSKLEIIFLHEAEWILRYTQNDRREVEQATTRVQYQ
jgi:hypothetical protein